MMRHPIEILLAGRSREGLKSLEEIMNRQPGVKVKTRVISNGHTDPLHDVAPLPDALIYVVSDMWDEELAALSARPPAARPPTLVVGPEDNVNLFRMAMRAGARDFFTLPVSEVDIAAALERLAGELYAAGTKKAADLTVIINAKGGSGASVVAANVAYIKSLDKDRRTVLVDMDLQFGAVPVYLDLTPNNGLLRALHEIDKMDGLAIEGLMLKHSSGLRVLATSADELVMSHAVPESRVAALFELLGSSYDEIVVDMPRQFDDITSVVVSRADRVVVMMEQSLAHLRDAKRLLMILQRVLGVDGDLITIIVNRYEKKGGLELKDIQKALGHDDVISLPGDFRRVNESINLGVPLYETAKNAPITKGLRSLSRLLGNQNSEQESVAHKRPGLFNWVRH
ncbi:MAG: pilus assembly protein CpaF [Gammaproteobacteria bacterium]|nr:MAG: pilus assembly protein CpaF [Gammaproteobacteria bacterium]